MMMCNVFGFFGFYFEIKTKPKKPKKTMVFIMLGFLNLEPWLEETAQPEGHECNRIFK